MKKRFTDEQIIGFLKENEAGVPTPDLCRRHGFSSQSFYRWKSKFGGMEANQVRELKELHEENRKLKQMVAEQALDIRGLQAALKKKY